MRLLKYVVGLALVAGLAACGGGGGSAGTSSGSAPLALKLAAPNSVTVAPGSAVKYAISGGYEPYSANSDNATITRVAVDQNNALTVGGVLEGVTKVQVYDAKLNSVDITVNVSAGPSIALFTTAPSPLTLVPSDTQNFSIAGGRPPYVVFSDKVSVALATVNGTALKITAVAVGNANIKITDALGATNLVAITVASTGAALAIAPTSAQTYVNTEVVVGITGGSPPFSVVGGIPAAYTTDFTKGVRTMTVRPLLVSSGLDISVMDSQNQIATFTLTVIEGQPTLRLSPNALTVSETNSGAIDLTVFGASGAIAAFSSDLSLFSTTVNRDTITLTRLKCVAADTPVTITVVDANRALATAVIKVKDNGNVGVTNCP